MHRSLRCPSKNEVPPRVLLMPSKFVCPIIPLFLHLLRVWSRWASRVAPPRVVEQGTCLVLALARCEHYVARRLCVNS
ncbi:hypothetical protein BDA96_04G257900 [Sorghum bicolor]|uniref:Uncharacterized protein n=2 Tax=Sorghum bicolor TaxID=4558 RepID=A0A921R7V7_SORBI|nr:hypothetical protein BDA96_04G257900 [Sorghum bicolor]OQU85437.1 hypothetical protein SORBI_3004G242250 [Sorghum bicolor]